MSKKILIIDSDAKFHRNIMQALGIGEKYSCLSSYNGRSALILLRSEKEKFPDFIILSPELSDDSRHIAEVIREMLPCTPILLSGDTPDLQIDFSEILINRFINRGNMEGFKDAIEYMQRHQFKRSRDNLVLSNN